MRIFQTSTLALALALAACGGSGSSGSSGSGGVSPQPSPTPTATPTPTPTPTPPPAFGLSAPFELTTGIGVEYQDFTFTDPASIFPRWRLIEAGLLDNASSATLSFQPDPESFRLTYDGQEYSYTAADLSNGGENRIYRRGEFALSLDSILTTGTQVMVLAHVWPGQGHTENTEVGTAQRHLVAPIGNISVEQAVIDSPVLFESVPRVIGSDIYMTKATASVRTIGQGVNISFFLYRNVDNAAQFVGELRLKGTLDAQSNMVSGTIADAADSGTQIGTFSGALYGPGRETLGLAFQFVRPQEGGRIYAGWMLAPRLQQVVIGSN